MNVHALVLAAAPWLSPALVHGEMDPEERSSALRAFAEDDTRLLVCTDVAARGLDFAEVRHVINYDLPRDVNTFIHRAGRTARRGQAGLVSSLVTSADAAVARAMREHEDAAGSALQESGGRPGRESVAVEARRPPARPTQRTRRRHRGHPGEEQPRGSWSRQQREQREQREGLDGSVRGKGRALV